jgi:hypothetical protein
VIAPLDLDVRLTATADRNVQVGCRDAQLPRARLGEHVRQHRDRTLALDDALDEVQLADEIVLPDAEFHALLLIPSLLSKDWILFGGETLRKRGKTTERDVA